MNAYIATDSDAAVEYACQDWLEGRIVLVIHCLDAVIPAKAGIHVLELNGPLDSRFRGNDRHIQ